MTRVLYDQTTFSNKRAGEHGDCARACVCTILQMDPSRFPHPMQRSGQWNTEFHRCLREIGFAIRSVDCTPGNAGDVDIIDLSWARYPVPTLVMACGPSARGVLHAVVYDRRAQRIIHDPHPSRSGLEEIQTYDYLAPYPVGTVRQEESGTDGS